MDFAYQQFKRCGIKIKTEVNGGDEFSSGFIYQTSYRSKYNYVFTTKHTFKESYDDKDIFIEDIKYIEVQCFSDKKFTRYEFIPERIINERLILFEDDLVIILVSKNEKFEIPYIQVSDAMQEDCRAWATTQADENSLFPLKLTVSDNEVNRLTLDNWNNSRLLKGCSGAGILSKKTPILYGFIKSYPAEEFQGGYIDAVDIKFKEINDRLYSEGFEELSSTDTRKRRIVNDKLVVDANKAPLNGVIVDLELARDRLRIDSYDDWFHDPLNFVDILHEDYLFNYFGDYFSDKNYKVSRAEIFYLPKRSFTLRRAMIIPYPDRIYYASLVEILGQRIDNALIPTVYSARYNKLRDRGIIISGVEQWKKMLYKLKEHSFQFKYVIEIDILNFYDNIDIDLLCDKIDAVCQNNNERKAAKKLRIVLKKFSSNKNIGISQNSDISSLLATFYLNQVDTYMYNHVPIYIRFMDDIYIFCNDEFVARKYLTLMEKELRRLNLSLNGQKTQITNLKTRKKKEKDAIIEKYRSPFDLEKSKLARFSTSNRIGHINEGFHLGINMLLDNMQENPLGTSKNERKLFQAISAVKRCTIKGVNLDKNSGIKLFLEQAGELIKREPWATPQVCTLVGVLKTEYIPEVFWTITKEIVMNDRFNTYPWQCYNLWLLFAKHKIEDSKLRKYASNYLDSNDETSRPVIAGMMIYMGSIDINYRRVLRRKYNNSFTRGKFQERIALITLRSFETSIINFKDEKRKAMHKSLYQFKDKELVYIPGEINESDVDLELLQIYSL